MKIKRQRYLRSILQRKAKKKSQKSQKNQVWPNIVEYTPADCSMIFNEADSFLFELQKADENLICAFLKTKLASD